MSTYANLLYHIVFSTKGRVPLISGEVKEPLYESTGGIICGEGGILLEIGGMPDHVHLLAKFRTDLAVATMVKKIKGKSRSGVMTCEIKRNTSSGRKVTELSPSANPL
jgi:putative transposase